MRYEYILLIVLSLLVDKIQCYTCILLFPSQEGRTALSLASYEGHSDTVRILVQRGANTDVQDEVGEGKVEQ